MSSISKTKITKPSIRNRIEGFDELRGIAIVMVLIAHWCLVYPPLATFNLGPIGVDIFFVISGFLIGLILYRSKGQPGYYQNFYVRRVFRIFPLAAVLVLLGLALQLMSRGNAGSVLYYVAFVQNYIPAFAASNSGGGVDVFPLPVTSPMWSLAVEEHVYLFLPLIVGVTPRKIIPLVVSFIAVVGIVTSIWTVKEYGGSWYTNLHETWNRLHYIAFGVLLCRKEWWLYIVSVLLIWLILLVVNDAGGLIQYTVGVTICGLIYRVREGAAPIRNRCLAFIGKLCYGIYLLHYPVAVLFKELAARSYLDSVVLQVLAFGTYLIISVILAMISFKYFEMPIQLKRTKFEA